MKISKSQVLQIIKEEAQKVKKEIILKRELAAIDQQLASLNEVEAGGNMAPGKDGVHAGQKKPVFQTKPGFPDLKMEDEDDDTIMGSEEGGEEMSTVAGAEDMTQPSDMSPEMGGTDMAGEMGPEEGITREELLAAIKELGMKLNLSGVVDFDAVPEGELEVDIQTGAEDAAGAETGEDPELEIGSEVPAEEPTDIPSSEEPTETPSEEPSEESPEDNVDEQVQKLNEEKSRWAILSGIKKLNN